MKPSSKLDAAVDWYLWFFHQPQSVWWVLIGVFVYEGLSQLLVDWRGGIDWFVRAAAVYGVLKALTYCQGVPAWPRGPVSLDGIDDFGRAKENASNRG